MWGLDSVHGKLEHIEHKKMYKKCNSLNVTHPNEILVKLFSFFFCGIAGFSLKKKHKSFFPTFEDVDHYHPMCIKTFGAEFSTGSIGARWMPRINSLMVGS